MDDIEINYYEKFKSVISVDKSCERASYRNILGFSTFHKDSKFDFNLNKLRINGIKQNFNKDELKIKNFPSGIIIQLMRLQEILQKY